MGPEPDDESEDSGLKRHRVHPTRLTRARQLRQDMTFPERLLWSRLRRGLLGGVRFRRQHPMGPYVADFYCPSAALVIELDGMSHGGRERQDAERTRYLEGRGLSVVRYTNDQVIEDVDAVAEDIARLVGVQW